MTDENVVAVIAHTPQGLFAIGAEDRFVGLALRQEGAYGLGEIQNATLFFRPQEEVLVVGAHVGTVAIPLARIARHVTMIEANPWTFKLLEANLALNDVTNATAIHVAASDKREALPFVVNTENSGGSKRWPLVQDHEYFYDDPKVIEVEAASLDELLQGRDEFAFVLMDIEGGEAHALRGMQRILAGARALMVEYIPRHLKQVVGIDSREWLEPILPHFEHLYVPVKQKAYRGEQEMIEVLQQMYEANEDDSAIIFSKDMPAWTK